MYVTTPIESVPAINRRIVPALKRLGIKTIRDLLFHFPIRYDDFSNEKPIEDISVGETVTIHGTIEKISVRRTFRKRMALTEVTVRDETGALKAIWFNQPFLARNLKAGNSVRLSGKVAKGPEGIYLQNPSYEKIHNSQFGIRDSSKGVHTGGLVAIYPETRGITSRWLRYLISKFIRVRFELVDPIPSDVLRRNNLGNLRSALLSIHVPKTKEEARVAEWRFIFENLFYIQLHALRERLLLKRESAPAVPLDVPLMKKFVGSLPFSLTDSQRRSLWEILNDMTKPSPMNRLLEGDVGSGKTVVAAASALSAVRAGFRVLFMAPTEILARQHLVTLEKLLSPFGVSIGFRTGTEKRADDSDIIVGTHALIQKGITFEKLGLVVVDEQHRFGVNQRAQLVKDVRNAKVVKNDSNDFNDPPTGGDRTILTSEAIPHYLSMSATPIPRTLALTVYGDLDLSILDEMPKSRKPVITEVVEPREREKTYEFIRSEIKKGRQVFVICPRIEESNYESGIMNKGGRAFQQKLLLAEVKSVKEEYRKLSHEVFPDLRVEMLHGKMKSKEKAAVMERFKKGESDILVSTSVVEVGVDIPNATIMMIEGAERFGLAQLHQFRGRVGRGADQSYCFLFPTEGGGVSRRLRAVRDAKSGFELAQKDLEIRGPGDLFGTVQSGFSRDMLKGITDVELVRAVRKEAIELLRNDSDLHRHPVLKQKLAEMEEMIHWE